MKIFLIYHSHIDNGYTERQEKISQYQADFIKQAIELVLSEKQAERSEKEKFKFTAEGFWAVEQYLNKYKEEGKTKLIRAVKTGNFELTGCYFHLAELLDEYNLGRSLDYVRKFTNENGLKAPEIAMSADVNGFSYGFADCLAERGIKYLSTNINVHHGGPPFKKPFVPFFWKSIKGARILVYSGMPYHKANLFGLIPGFAPYSDTGIPGFEPRYKLADYVTEEVNEATFERITGLFDLLKRQDYPFDFVPVMGSAVYTDNSPASDAHCNLIADWNKKFGDQIEIVTSTQKEFFEHLEKYSNQIAEYEGDWNDWWTDGVLSSPEPLRLFMNAQRTQKLINMIDKDNKIISKNDIDEISKNLIHYAEHTFGHSQTLELPTELLVKQIEYRKTKYAVEADIKACSLLDKLTYALGESEFTASRPFNYKIINPHNKKVTAVVNLPVDYWEEKLFAPGEFGIIDESGKTCDYQITNIPRGKAICVIVTLNPREEKKLSVVFGKKQISSKEVFDPQNRVFENEYFILKYDSGGISSITDKISSEELLNKNATRLGQPVYQIFDSKARGQAVGANYTPRIIPENQIYNGEIVNIFPVESGSVFTCIRAVYAVKNTKSYSVDFKLYSSLPKMEVSVRYIKDPVFEPEGLYAAIPFNASGAFWYLSKAGAFIRADNQLPGVCHDYFTLGKGAALTNGKNGVTLNTLDTPLIALDELKLWRYSSETNPSGCLYSWLMNNKWETNFNAECSGSHQSRYVIEFFSGINTADECEEILIKNEIEPLVLRCI